MSEIATSTLLSTLWESDVLEVESCESEVLVVELVVVSCASVVATFREAVLFVVLFDPWLRSLPLPESDTCVPLLLPLLESLVLWSSVEVLGDEESETLRSDLNNEQ